MPRRPRPPRPSTRHLGHARLTLLLLAAACSLSACLKALPPQADAGQTGKIADGAGAGDGQSAGDGKSADAISCEGGPCGAACTPTFKGWQSNPPAAGAGVSNWIAASVESGGGTFHAITADPKPGLRTLRAVRLDATGKVICDKPLPISGYVDTIRDATALPSGDVALVGQFREYWSKPEPWSADFWLLRVNASCDVVWQQRVGLKGGYNRGYGIAADGDRLVAVGGWADKADSTAHRRPVVMAVSAKTGAELWRNSYDGLFATSVITLPKTVGGYAVTGREVEPDGWLMRLDTKGKVIWRHSPPNTGANDSLLRVVHMADGDFVTSGYTDGSGAGKTDLWLVRFDPKGKVRWQATFGGAAQETTGGLAADGADALLTGSTSNFGAGSRDGWLIRVDAKGKQRWAKTFGTTDGERFETLLPLSGGGFMATGSQNKKPWVVRLDDCDDL